MHSPRAGLARAQLVYSEVDIIGLSVYLYVYKLGTTSTFEYTNDR
jgi:hypothetical protein